MPNILQDGEIVLYGFVGDNFWDEGFTARDVLAALAEIGRETDVTVRINSGGGYVDDGVAIYNALAAHKGKVSVVVDAIAASSASVIAMAGDSITMRLGSLMMIHDPAGVTFGTAADHESRRVELDKFGAQIAAIYAERTGSTVEAVRTDMKATLWMTAEEAVGKGFADQAEGTKARAVAAFDYRVYANAPPRLTSMAKRKDWSLAEAGERALATAQCSIRPAQEKTTMTEKTAGEAPQTDKLIAEAAAKAVADYKTRRSAVLNSDEAKGREALAEKLIETTMAVDDIKAALVLAPAADNEIEQIERPEAYAAGRAKALNGLAAPSAAATGANPTNIIDRGSIFAARNGR